MARLAYLLKKFPRLSETFILNEVLAQESLGRDLHIFSRRAADDEPRHPELERLRAEVEIMPAAKGIDPWRALFDEEGDPEERFASVGRVVRGAKEWEHPRFSTLLSEALWLRRRTQELGITHIHTHFATDSAVAAMLLHELGGPSYSITAHAKDIYRSTVDPVLLERMFAGSSFVVTVCDANVRHLAEQIGAAGMSHVRRLYNGIDLSAFAPSAEGERDPNLILSVGRLVAKKGFDVFIDAIAILRAEGRPLRAVIVGDGEEREALALRIEECGMSGVIELAGPLGADEVRTHLAHAGVFCLPCVIGPDGNRDALPTVLLEALANGAPIVSTPVTGIPEILDQGSCGILVPEHDSTATARALGALLDDPERRQRLVEAGHVHVRANFDLAKQSKKLGAWFDAVLQTQEQAERCESPA